MATISSHPPGHGAHIAGAPPRTVPERNGTLPGAPTSDEPDGRTADDPARVSKPESAERRSKGESKA